MMALDGQYAAKSLAPTVRMTDVRPTRLPFPFFWKDANSSELHFKTLTSVIYALPYRADKEGIHSKMILMLKNNRTPDKLTAVISSD
jgi:hypothetical protein